MSERILVLGMGDVLRQDAGVGVHALETLYREDWPEEVVFADDNGFSFQEFGALKDFSAVLVLDSFQGGHEPGTVYRLGEEDLDAGWGDGVSWSREDVLHCLYTAELMGRKPQFCLLGMEPSGSDWGTSLSETLRGHFPSFVDHAREELQRLLPQHRHS